MTAITPAHGPFHCVVIDCFTINRIFAAQRSTNDWTTAITIVTAPATQLLQRLSVQPTTSFIRRMTDVIFRSELITSRPTAATAGPVAGTRAPDLSCRKQTAARFLLLLPLGLRPVLSSASFPTVLPRLSHGRRTWQKKLGNDRYVLFY